MKNIFLVSIAFISILTSCNKDSTPESGDEKQLNNTSAVRCYSFVSAKDSMLMKLNILGNTVTGDLEYKFFEKDQNKGTFQGTMRGDTLFATYTFMSEGIESVREIIFLKTDNDFVEGYADVEEKNGVMKLKNKSPLTFNNNMILKHVDCAR